MTWAEQLRQEGEKVAVTRHLEQARQRVKKMLTLKFQVLTPQQVERVDAADEATLERWTVQILTAPSIEALFKADSD